MAQQQYTFDVAVPSGDELSDVAAGIMLPLPRLYPIP